MEFPPVGGPFTGTVQLELVHDVPDRGCQFQSTHVWEFSGEFDPATGQFSGTWVEIEDATFGACENFSFVRDFDPPEEDFTWVLIAQLGRISGRVATSRFTLEVDPALFEAPAPTGGGETSDLTTDPGQTSELSHPQRVPRPCPLISASAGKPSITRLS